MEWFLVVYVGIVLVSIVMVLNKLEENDWRPVVDEMTVTAIVITTILEGLMVWWAVATYGWVPIVVAFAIWKVIGLFWLLGEKIAFGGARYTIGQSIFGIVISAGLVYGFALL